MGGEADRENVMTRAAELSSYDFLSSDESEEAQLLLEALRAAVVRVDGENAMLMNRRDELLALVARISQETPLPDEVRDALAQRGALLAEVGTLRAANASHECSIERLICESEERYQAHRDAQAMLEEVAAERDARASQVRDLLLASRSFTSDRRRRALLADAADLIASERDRLAVEVAARDAALDACANRIADLLAARELEASLERSARAGAEWWARRANALNDDIAARDRSIAASADRLAALCESGVLHVGLRGELRAIEAMLRAVGDSQKRSGETVITEDGR